MIVKRKSVLVLAAVVVFCSLARAQEPRVPTLEERVTALESRVAALDTRFELGRTLDGRGSAASATTDTRILELERSLERLTVDLQRLEREADTAMREARSAAMRRRRSSSRATWRAACVDVITVS
jgi:hypothetical protein